MTDTPVRPGSDSLHKAVLVVIAVAIVVGLFFFAGRTPQREVVVYTSVDEVPARKVLDEFQKATGITVRPVFDTEAAKTTGLALRLMAEMSRPRADVFWNNELSQTLALAKKGALEKYESPAAADIPAGCKDPSGCWAAMALRARVIVYNTELVSAADAPKTLDALLNPRWRGRVGIADPRFGTTACHTAALCEAWGRERALSYFKALAGNGARVYQGNSVVRDAAASGEILVGLTDTDDVLLGISRGMQIACVLPDQGAGEIGTLVIPAAVSVVKGAPHPAEARILVDYLLGAEVEASFANPKEGWLPVRPSAASLQGLGQLSSIRPIDVNAEAVSELTAPFSAEVAALLVK